MLVRCLKTFRHQITENNTYLVIELLINFSKKITSYRIIDNEGYPAIYDADKFEIISNKINDFGISLNENGVILSHNLIINSELNKRNLEGYWGLYIEDDINAKEVLQDVVNILSAEENIVL